MNTPAPADMIPTTWLDPLLSGPNAVIGIGPYTGTDIENLLRALKKRVQDTCQPPAPPKDAEPVAFDSDDAYRLYRDLRDAVETCRDPAPIVRLFIACLSA